MKFTGIFEGEQVTFELDGMGRLIMTHEDGTEEPFNVEYYDEDQYSTIRAMLIHEGVKDLKDA